MAQKIVASLFLKTFDFPTISVHVFEVKNGWQRTQIVKKHPVVLQFNTSQHIFYGFPELRIDISVSTVDVRIEVPAKQVKPYDTEGGP